MSKTDYIDILQGCSSTLRNDYGIKSLRIFGSIARGEDHEDSDVDVFVEMFYLDFPHAPFTGIIGRFIHCLGVPPSSLSSRRAWVRSPSGYR